MSNDISRIDKQLVTKFANIKGNTWQEKLDTLDICKCCTRHQINKPNHFAPWKELPFHEKRTTSCICSCRHDARFICRQFNCDTVEKKNIVENNGDKWLDIGYAMFG